MKRWIQQIYSEWKYQKSEVEQALYLIVKKSLQVSFDIKSVNKLPEDSSKVPIPSNWITLYYEVEIDGLLACEFYIHNRPYIDNPAPIIITRLHRGEWCAEVLQIYRDYIKQKERLKQSRYDQKFISFEEIKNRKRKDWRNDL